MLRHSCAHALQQELPTSAPNGAQGKGNMLFGRFSFYRFRFRVAWERSSTDSKVQMPRSDGLFDMNSGLWQGTSWTLLWNRKFARSGKSKISSRSDLRLQPDQQTKEPVLRLCSLRSKQL